MTTRFLQHARNVLAGALGALLGAALIPAARQVDGGHPWTCEPAETNPVCTEGSCHRGNHICRNNYQLQYRGSTPGAPGQPYMYIRDIPQWVDPATGINHASTFDSPALSAELAWRFATGPQYPSRDPQPNDSWNFLNARDDPQFILAQGGGFNLLGITYLCNEESVPTCSNLLGEFPIEIQWADVYLNTRLIPFSDSDDWRSTFAHELGHTFGLGHHSGVAQAVMEPTSNSHTTFAPTDVDIGVPIDTRGGGVAADLYGIRGIYGWYETPTPGPTATPGSGGGPGGCNPGQGKCT